MNLFDNTRASRFEMHEGEHISFANYRKQGKSLYIDHVEVPPELRGSGVASRLMQGVADAAKTENMEIIPICSYAALWLKRHPQE